MVADYGTVFLWRLKFKPCFKGCGAVFEPSADWKRGGPVIEREGISSVLGAERVNEEFQALWFCKDSSWNNQQEHASLLVAVMRCCVAAHISDWIEVPDKLGK